MIPAPEHLSRAYHEVLDDPRKWVPAMSRPTLFDSDAFQKQIDAITGGKRIVRLSWGPEIVEWNPRAIGTTPRDEFKPQHVALWDTTGEPVAPPRWMLEERLEPETYFETWEQNRWFRDPRDGLLYDQRGPAPREGRWRWIATVRDHDANCCEQRLQSLMVCWGYYRDPGECELKMIREKWAQIQRDKEVNPFAKPEHLPEGQAEKDLASRMRNEQRERRETSTSFWVDRLKTQTLDLPTLHGFVTRGLMKTDDVVSIPTIHAQAAKEAAQRKFAEEPT
jgi:hypothetical protein